MQGASEDDAPAHFLCPITQELMIIPTVNEAGQTYERESIVQWYAMGNLYDPLTRKEIKDAEALTLNTALQAQINEWKQECVRRAQRKEMETEDLRLAWKLSARDRQKAASPIPASMASCEEKDNKLQHPAEALPANPGPVEDDG